MNYFVSYMAEKGILGCCKATRTRPITTWEDIQEVSKQIAESLDDVEHVVILNYILLGD